MHVCFLEHQWDCFRPHLSKSRHFLLSVSLLFHLILYSLVSLSSRYVLFSLFCQVAQAPSAFALDKEVSKKWKAAVLDLEKSGIATDREPKQEAENDNVPDPGQWRMTL